MLSQQFDPLRRTRLANLAPLLTCLLLLGCRSGDPRAELQSFLTEDPQRADLAELVERRQQKMDTFAEERSAFVSSFRELNADHDADPGDLTALLKRFEASLMAHREGLIDVALEMRAASGPDDWARFAELDLGVLLQAAGSNPLFPSDR